MALVIPSNLLARIQYGMDENGHWTESGRDALELAFKNKRLLEIIKYEAASSIAPAHIDERNSAAFDGAVKALRTFETGAGANLESYVKIVVRRELISLHRVVAKHALPERLDGTDVAGRNMADVVAAPDPVADETAIELLEQLKETWMDFLYSIAYPECLLAVSMADEIAPEQRQAIRRIVLDAKPDQLQLLDRELPGDRPILIAWQNRMLDLGYEVFDGIALGQSVEMVAELHQVPLRLVNSIIRSVGVAMGAEWLEHGEDLAA